MTVGSVTIATFGLGDEIERAVGLGFGLHRETAAMAAGDATLVAVAQRRARHIGQGRSTRIAALVDMQVDVEIVARGEA